MKNLRQLVRHSRLLINGKRPRRTEKPRGRNANFRNLGTETLEKRELLAGDVLSPQHNYWNSYDVNDDGQITARDALAVINRLSAGSGEGELGSAVDDESNMFYDVNADHQVTALDALTVVNALGRGEAEVGELIELQLRALSDPDDIDSEISTVNVGETFHLEVSYEDLRLFNDQLGAFQLFTDIAVSQPNILAPVLNEAQQIIIGEEFTQSPFPTGLTFGREGTAQTVDSTFNDFANDSSGEIRRVLTEFGLNTSQFTVETFQLQNNDDLGFTISYVGEEFGNVDVPDLTVTVNGGDVPTQFIEFAPFEADGVTPNSDAVRFNINSFSRTFNDNEEFYSAQNGGSFDLTDGFTGIGGLGPVPTEGGGVPQLTDDGSFIEPFDAYSIPVVLRSAVSNFQISVNPGEDDEATLLYGRSETVTQDMVLIDEDAVVTITAIGLNVGEFSIDPTTLSINEGAGTATFTVNRTGGSTGAATVGFSTTAGTATAGSDFAVTSGTLSFAEGVTSQTFTVAIIDDGVAESDESFTVAIAAPTGGATIGINSTSTVTIIDDDAVVANPGVLSISPVTTSVAEGAGTATFTVNRTGGTDGAVTVNFATSDGTALAGSDYTANSGTLSFADGQSSQTISVAITQDVIDEPNENFTVSINGPTGGATLGTNVTSTATIVDDDNVIPAPGVLTLSQANVSVDEGAGTATFTVNRTGGSDGTVGVTFNTANGTATAGSDYTANTGTLTFAAGETSQSFTVAITDDNINEANETFTVSISSPSGGATLGATTTSTATIIDNDDAPVPGVISISPSAISINEDVGTITFTINRTGGSDGAVAVGFATANGTAIAGSDFIANSGTINFADGEMSKTVSVTIIDDTVEESDETFTVAINNPSNGATLGTGSTSTVTILANDVVVVNNPPVAVDDIAFVAAGTTTVINVLDNDSAGPPNEDQTLTIVAASSTSGAVAINGDGTLSFTPNNGFLGNATISYTIQDSSGAQDSALVSVTVQDVVFSTVSGEVFIDNIESLENPTRNGIKDGFDVGIGGLQVRLVSSTGATVAAVRTRLDGSYSFNDVAPGNYTVVYDVPDTLQTIGSTSADLIVDPDSGSSTPTAPSLTLAGTTGTATEAVSLLSSSYLRANQDISTLSDGGRQGGLVTLDESGVQEIFIAGAGFEDVVTGELLLNSAGDAALMVIVREGATSAEVASVGSDHFVVSANGRGVQFFGGEEDFNFVSVNADPLEIQFAGFVEAVDRVLADL